MKYIKTTFKDFILEHYDNNDNVDLRLHEIINNYYTKNYDIPENIPVIKDTKLQWLFNQIIGMIDELKNNNINTGDFLNIDNWGIKQNGNLGIFDIGFGDWFEKFDNEPEQFKLDESSLYKEIIKNNLNKILDKLNININDIKYINSGLFGSAYNYNDKVLKISKDKSEAINSYKIINKDMTHIVNIYDVKQFDIEDEKFFIIIEEKLDTTTNLKVLYKKLEKIFDDVVNKHLNNDIIDKITIKHPIVGNFLKDMTIIGYDKTWTKYNKYFMNNRNILDKYDFNDISEISNWIKNSVTNDNFIIDEPPTYIIDLVNSLI